MTLERESLCALEPGKEEDAFKIIGPFDIEECGPFLSCSHKVEKFDYTNGHENYIELFYCSVNWAQVAGVVFLFLIAYGYTRMKSKAVSVASSNIHGITGQHA